MDGGFHHHLLRKRVYRDLEPYPHPSPLKRFFDHLMYGVAVVAPLVLLPQVFTLYQTKDASGLSLITWCMLTVINVLWVVYASIHKERPIMIASSLMIILDLVISIGIIMYR